MWICFYLSWLKADDKAMLQLKWLGEILNCEQERIGRQIIYFSLREIIAEWCYDFFFIWILYQADIVYLIRIDILGNRIKVMKKWCLHIFIWRYKGICLLYSPRMWRWSDETKTFTDKGTVFSTHVEVIQNIVLFGLGQFRILHACGGDP